MVRSFTKKITKSLLIGIFVGFGIFISYAADISLLTQTINSGDKITKDRYNAVSTAISSINTKLVNIYNDGTNVGIGVASPSTKLDVAGNIKGTGLCIGSDCKTSWDSQQWNSNGLNIYYNTGGVGIGTDNPANTFQIGQNTIGNDIDYGISINRNGTLASPGIYGSQALIITDLASDGPGAIDNVGIFSVRAGRIADADINASNASLVRVANDNGTAMRIDGKRNTYIGYSPDITSSLTGSLLVSGNVGIGTSSPATKLEVAGTVKATDLEAKGSHILTTLNHCGGACASYHSTNTWVNVGAYNYTWATPINTNPALFTSNNKGTITVNKTGLYLIKINLMMIPTTERSRLAYGCPFINGGADCGGNSANDYLGHGYFPANRRGSKSQNLYMQLNAGNTVSYGYYIPAAMTHWAHDGYTSLGITRIN